MPHSPLPKLLRRRQGTRPRVRGGLDGLSMIRRCSAGAATPLRSEWAKAGGQRLWKRALLGPIAANLADPQSGEYRTRDAPESRCQRASATLP